MCENKKKRALPRAISDINEIKSQHLLAVSRQSTVHDSSTDEVPPAAEPETPHFPVPPSAASNELIDDCLKKLLSLEFYAKGDGCSNC